MPQRTGRTCALLPGLVIVAAPLLGACGDPAGDVARQEAAIKEAINSYLRDGRGLRPDAMQMELRDLRLDGEEAQAHVRFTAAGAPAGLEYDYHLRREAGVWKVIDSSGASHGEPQTRPLPKDHPPIPPDGTQGS